MQNIQLPDDQYQRLIDVAQAAGYADVTAFIVSLAAEPTEDPRGPLMESELRESAAVCERANSEIESGGGHDFREAMLDIGRELGFELPQ